MRIGALAFVALLASACAPEEAAPVAQAPAAPRSPEENVPVEQAPAVETSGAAIAGLHQAALAEPDPTIAAPMLEQACDRGFAPSCIALADRMAAGEGVEADPDRARGLLEQACMDGSTLACDRLGH